MSNYKTKIIPLHGNRALINRCRKAGLELYNPQGAWNGYGYTQLPMVCRINSVGEMRKFNKIKRELEENPPQKKTLSEEEKINQWARRLVRLTGIELQQAQKIARSKLRYKESQILMLEERQEEKYSVKRQKIINKIYRSNPLRRIENEEHAKAILDAYMRHTASDYEKQLEKAQGMAAWGFISYDCVREYALEHTTYYD